MRALQGVFALAGVALVVACGGSDKKAATPSAAATSTPASASATVTRPAATSTVAPVATATAALPTQAPDATATPPPAPPPENTQAPPPPVATEPPPPPPPSGGTLTVIAINLLFDATSLSAAAGPVTIVFNNQDKAIAHNIHFFSKSSGASIGMTEVTDGPSTDTLSLGTLAPGTYFYKCDVHPTTMTGVLTVS